MRSELLRSKRPRMNPRKCFNNAGQNDLKTIDTHAEITEMSTENRSARKKIINESCKAFEEKAHDYATLKQTSGKQDMTSIFSLC